MLDLVGEYWVLAKYQNMSQIPTWDHITKSDGCHGYEAKVERLKEVPVLPQGEKDGPATEEDAQEGDCTDDGVEVLGEAHLLLLLLFLSVTSLFQFMVVVNI